LPGTQFTNLQSLEIEEYQSRVRVVVLANTKLDGLHQRRREVLDRVADCFRRVSLEASIECVAAHDLTERAAAAARGGADAVVAAGGDGTISSVARALAESPTPLGILPLGTYNHFARDVGIPLPLEEAVAVIAAGTIRRVDVGQVNRHAFVNNASIGAYPAMVLDRDFQRVRFGRSKWRAMLLSSMRVLRRLPLLEVRLGVDAAPPWSTTPCVFVGNNRYRFDKFPAGTRSALDEGRLSVYAARSTTRWSVLRLGLKAALGRLQQDESLTHCELAEFWIESRRRHLAVGVDGEVLWLEPPLCFRSRPGALAVIVPG
jgi:diacylglycerol kinase family enzyme